MKWTLFIITFLSYNISYTQSSTLIKGKVICKSSPLVNIHIFNKNLKKGTTTDYNGKFEILANEKDTIILSAIHLNNKKIIISKATIFIKKVNVKMSPFINELDEIIIKNYNLTGYLLDDSKNVPINFKKNNSFRLSLDGIDFSAPGKTDKPSNTKVSNPLSSSETLNSISLVKVYKLLTRSIRKKRKAKIAYNESLRFVPDKIREEIGDDFFVNDLKIKKSLINNFIIYCNTKNIISLYKQGKEFEVINLLINESKAYLKSIK